MKKCWSRKKVSLEIPAGDICLFVSQVATSQSTLEDFSQGNTPNRISRTLDHEFDITNTCFVCTKYMAPTSQPLNFLNQKCNWCFEVSFTGVSKLQKWWQPSCNHFWCFETQFFYSVANRWFTILIIHSAESGRKLGHQKCEDQQTTCTSTGSTGSLLIFAFQVQSS